jgi:hypothetical protein
MSVSKSGIKKQKSIIPEMDFTNKYVSKQAIQGVKKTKAGKDQDNYSFVSILNGCNIIINNPDSTQSPVKAKLVHLD